MKVVKVLLALMLTISAIKLVARPVFGGENLSRSAESGPVEGQGAGTDPFLVIGHMGSPLSECENTLVGFKTALEEGANCIEMDLCMTADNTVVVWHDWSPNDSVALFRQLGRQGLKYRPTAPNLWERSRRKKVCDLTESEFRDAYGYKLRKGSDGPGTQIHPRIPTFAEAVSWAKGEPGLVYLFLDVKIPKDSEEWAEPLMKECKRLLVAAGMDDRAVFMSPHRNVLAALKKAAGDCGMNFSLDIELAPGVIVRPAKFMATPGALSMGNAFASVGKPVATLMGYKIYRKILAADTESLARSRSSGAALRHLVAWTIDSEEEMRDLAGLGVTGMMTNLPAKLAKCLDKMDIGRTVGDTEADGSCGGGVSQETASPADPYESAGTTKKLLDFIRGLRGN